MQTVNCEKSQQATNTMIHLPVHGKIIQLKIHIKHYYHP